MCGGGPGTLMSLSGPRVMLEQALYQSLGVSHGAWVRLHGSSHEHWVHCVLLFRGLVLSLASSYASCPQGQADPACS